MNPQATGYRSIVKRVDGSTRRHVLDLLGFSVHARELGRHTLYVALRHKEPIALVHVRSEMSEWGLVEIAWTFDLELRVLDFRLQRCRGASCKAAEGDAGLRQAFRGRSLDELRGWLKPEGEPAPMAKVSGEPKMLDTLVRSAMKTIAVTEFAWSADLPQLRRAAKPAPGGGGAP